MKTKRCSSCKKEYPVSDFHRDKGSKDGLDHRCKPCKRATVSKSARRMREKRYYARNENGRADKTKARNAARKLWGNIMNDFPCQVLGCSNKAKELAHLDYQFPTDVLPLCSHHHRMLDGRF